MMNDEYVELIGALSEKPMLTYSSRGLGVAVFDLCTEGRTVNCIAFRRSAEDAAECEAGDVVSVCGEYNPESPDSFRVKALRKENEYADNKRRND
jgi:hypothetical protein